MISNEITRINPGLILQEQDRGKKAAMIAYLAQQCRLDVFDLLASRGTGHWGGSSSAGELLTTLYFEMMKVRPKEIGWEDRDRFVLSKGHACSMLYAVLAQRGYFDAEELYSFRCLDSRLQGHPCMTVTAGVDMSTGALGHGLSVGLGMALAARVNGKGYRSFVMVGEGCLDEGQSWEAIMSAAKFKADGLVLLVDYNGVQLDGTSNEIMPLEPLVAKFSAFNWTVGPRVYDGHDVGQIMESWDWIQGQSGGPIVVIYKTHKGKGVSFMEDDHKWHGGVIDGESHAKGRVELIAKLKELEEQI